MVGGISASAGGQSPTDVPIGGGRRQLVGAVGGIAFALFGVALLVAPKVNVAGRAAGALNALIFGPAAVYLLVKSRGGRPMYLLARDGIRFPLHGWPTVPWSQVRGVRIASLLGSRYLAVDVDDPEPLIAGRGPLSRRAARRSIRRGRGLISIMEQLAPVSLEKVRTEIDRRRSTSGAAGPSESVAVPTPRRSVFARGGARAELLVGLHAGSEALRAGRSTSGGRTVLVAAFAVLLLAGAVGIRYRPKVGIPAVVVVEGVIIIANLSLIHAAIPVRVLACFLPVCVLILVLGKSPAAQQRA